MCLRAEKRPSETNIHAPSRKNPLKNLPEKHRCDRIIRISYLRRASLDEDDAHIDAVLGKEITERQRINFTEAALIRYFQPEYNTIYRDSFPNPMHTSYSECYDLDINSVMAEIDTEDMDAQFWSSAAAPAWQHFATYALHSRAEREAMFEFASLHARPSSQASE